MKNITEKIQKYEELLPASSPRKAATLVGKIIKLKKKYFN